MPIDMIPNGTSTAIAITVPLEELCGCVSFCIGGGGGGGGGFCGVDWVVIG